MINSFLYPDLGLNLEVVVLKILFCSEKLLLIIEKGRIKLSFLNYVFSIFSSSFLASYFLFIFSLSASNKFLKLSWEGYLFIFFREDRRFCWLIVFLLKFYLEVFALISSYREVILIFLPYSDLSIPKILYRSPIHPFLSKN